MDNSGRRILAQLMAQNRSLPYQSNLSPADQFGFANWVSDNQVPVDLSAHSDYDMPGFYKGLIQGDQQPQVSPVDNRMHYSDEYKTPMHRSFSQESKYAKPNAPKWVGNKLVDENGNVVHVDLPE